ncbi:RagB/SusD family nutrient uptake outer membrane protein [Zunongwangia atlantica]|uniref:SusD/RagB family protein n=1 Tax=Zunongwangia atlantica 22II14-10F7 TaxID=1185767 RepID=A0A1Y1T504_9FLAO|nr:RagB/SusD family nutrient uptake outer membrane protein [Zunongwangia atlantica]ORL46131.1 SusD/RagB family protein [Zunongwangia atlantica 22II14-10F7]
MKINLYIKNILTLSAVLFLVSCEDFVEVAPPDNKLVREEVFRNENTVISAMNGIYNQLFLASYINGSSSSITYLTALSADNIKNIRTTNLDRLQFEENEIIPDNEYNYNLWSSAYNSIYLVNSFLEGLSEATEIDEELRLRLEGESRFIRAFTYFYLVNLYGEVPLILSSDYTNNALASRTEKEQIYNQILDDLLMSAELLTDTDPREERIQVDVFTVKAFLARFYLYQEQWELASQLSSEVIANTQDFELLENLDEVFLANSKEAIWQLSPIGRGGNTQTNEGNLFIHSTLLPFFVSNAIEDDFFQGFTNDDLRLLHWIGYNESLQEFFVYKYKIWNSGDFPITEYSMVLRLAEQYLIRAESRLHTNNRNGAIADLDIIRQRAGLDLIADINPNINDSEVLEIIMAERRKELFAEWGHRWFDLKRTDKATDILGTHSQWEETDLLFPIPSQERMKNPNLSQNLGY